MRPEFIFGSMGGVALSQRYHVFSKMLKKRCLQLVLVRSHEYINLIYCIYIMQRYVKVLQGYPEGVVSYW